MSRMKVDFEIVREIALALPSAEEGSLHGAPTVKVFGRLLACPALHKSAEPNSIVVRVGMEERVELLTRKPTVYYITDHYRNYPSVLARLDRMDRKTLHELLEIGWRFVTLSAKRGGSRGRRTK